MSERQRGVAMMTAIILVALAAVLAVGIAFSSAMSARRGAAVFGVEQSVLYAQGAEGLAAYVLSQDDRKVDATSEPWAKPFPRTEVAPGVTLEAQLEDQAGKFNLNSLVDADGNPDANAVAQFQYLLQTLEIEPYWAEKLADWIDTDPNSMSQGGEESLYLSQTPAYLPPNLAITSVTELLQLPEFGRERFMKLVKYVTALPPGTPFNVCTASGEVLDAFYSGIDRQLVQTYTKSAAMTTGRTSTGAGTGTGTGNCFPGKGGFAQNADASKTAELTRRIAETSDYFRLYTRVSIGTTQFTLYSLMFRDGQRVRPVLRTYGTE